MWEIKFGLKHYMWNQLYTDIYKFSSANRIKHLKNKLIHNIIATNENL